MAYDSSFFDIIRPGCQSSARVVVPEVCKRIDPINTVIDIGCGEGWWAFEFEKLGAIATGIDAYGSNSPKNAPLHYWIEADITEDNFERWAEDIKYDLAICLEVAEHLPEQSAGALIDFLCSKSGNVLFSAAIPMQGGVGHINEQWPNYWIHKFNARGYVGKEFGSEFWGNSEVEPWYQQNMYIFTKMMNPNDSYRQECYPIIHPAFWSTRTGAPLP